MGPDEDQGVTQRVSRGLDEDREDFTISARSVKSSKGRDIDRRCAVLIGCTHRG
jgi:hypothetical protein